MSNTILVTGGTGYIGSHTVTELLESGNKVVIYDNLSNSSPKVINRIRSIAGISRKNPIPLTFVQGDLRDTSKLDRLFADYKFDSVIHFAGLKAVRESISNPLEYYSNNVFGTLCLCKAMNKANVKILVFSSSATVYGENAPAAFEESLPVGNTTNPYGTSKAMIEKILSDQCIADPAWSVAKLRYFNPIGAHKSGLIGEDPISAPNNLLPNISLAAEGKLKEVSVFGGDYPTPDGTAIRDYIHVVDLARGHLKALEKIQSLNKNSDVGSGEHIWNLGTGAGTSVLQVIKAFEIASQTRIACSIKERRLGDIAKAWANTEKSYVELGWTANYDLKIMVEDAWHWRQKNPEGYN